LDKLWSHSMPPAAFEVMGVLQSVEPSRNSAATIVCFGDCRMPACGEPHFEPYVITTSRRMGYRLLWIPIGGALIFWTALDYLRQPPGFRSGFPYCNQITFLAVSTLVAWLWNTSISPKYVRPAPGGGPFLQL